MIPPSRHLSDTLAIRTAAVPVPESSLRRLDSGEQFPVGSYHPSESLLGSSPVPSLQSSRVDDTTLEFSEENSVQWYRRSGSGKMASSFPGGGFESAALRTALEIPEKSAEVVREVLNDVPTTSEPAKPKPTKAERRALQEAQRAAKAAGKKPAPVFGGRATSKPVKPSQKKEMQKKDTTTVASCSVAASDKKGGDRSTDRRKDGPAPRSQFDDKSRREKAKRCAMVNQTEAENRVELFRHLPQYERGTQVPDLESKFFILDPVHPAIYMVGMKYLAGDVSGGNACCIAMLTAFQEAIRDYSTPPEKTLVRDLTEKISSYVSFFIEYRPLSISMGNAVRFIKSRVVNH